MALSHVPAATPLAPSAPDAARETRQAPALLAFTLAAFSAVIIFLPPEGRIATPLHDLLAALLGRAAFLVPVALAFGGVLFVVRALRPATCLPYHRLAGIGLITLAVLPSEYLLEHSSTPNASTGLVGQWLSTWLLDLVGGPATLVVLVAVLGLGVLLAFDVRLLRAATPTPEAPAGGQWPDAAS